MSSNEPMPENPVERAKPESFRGRSLSASLSVKDVEKSVAWYRDVIGFTVDQQYEREGKLMAVSLKAGDVHILVGRDDGAKGWDRLKGEGMSLQITTTQDIDEIAQRIKSVGAMLETEPTTTPWGARTFRLKDPDGFKLVISSVRAEDQ